MSFKVFLFILQPETSRKPTQSDENKQEEDDDNLSVNSSYPLNDRIKM